MRIADYIGRVQSQSFVLVLLMVTVLLLIVFGSPRAGLAAMVPNVYPALITFGAMGLWNIPLDADTLIIAPLIIGIAVDDTIHFITRYRAFALETGDVQASCWLRFTHPAKISIKNSSRRVFIAPSLRKSRC